LKEWEKRMLLSGKGQNQDRLLKERNEVLFKFLVGRGDKQ